jgi:hypothetical protein
LRDILQEILVRLEPGYTLLATLKPEAMHIFYASVSITAFATPEAIRLVIQIPLRTESRTYLIYTPVPVPTFEPVLRKFAYVQVGDQKIAISSDKRSYAELPPSYLQN